jgi:1,2-diacylglycerol 3-alpha-glucosyltransferase
MKIALVTDTYAPRINGVSTAVDTLAAGYRQRGHEVQIFAPEFPGHEDESPGVRRVPAWCVPLDPEDRLANPWHRATADYFVDQGFDVVHTQTPFTLGFAALGWARRSGARIVHTYHTLFSAYIGCYLKPIPPSLSVRIVRMLSRRYCDACDLVVVPSHALRRELADCRVGTRIEVIPTGIEPAAFRPANPAAFRAAYGFGPEDRCLLFAGRLADEKNVDFLLRALQEIVARDGRAKLLLAGDGPAKQRLKQLAVDLGVWDRVYFLGYLRGPELTACYAAADLFVFSSLTETQGLVVLEAMAAGTPVVAVGAMGVRETLADGRGGILTGPDVTEFSAAVLAMLADRGLYERKKAGCSAAVEEWSSAGTAERMLAAYRSLA